MIYQTISKSKSGFSYTNPTKIKEHFNKLGYRLMPVVGKTDKFWITGKTEDGVFYDFISGPKDYQLVIERFEFGISAPGDLNGWQFAREIQQTIKKAA